SSGGRSGTRDRGASAAAAAPTASSAMRGAGPSTVTVKTASARYRRRVTMVAFTRGRCLPSGRGASRPAHRNGQGSVGEAGTPYRPGAPGLAPPLPAHRSRAGERPYLHLGELPRVVLPIEDRAEPAAEEAERDGDQARIAEREPVEVDIGEERARRSGDHRREAHQEDRRAETAVDSREIGRAASRETAVMAA